VGPLPELEAPPENSFIYASDGSLLDEINFQENREPVTYDRIPDIMVDAVVATEDAEFWDHNGVNSDAILRSALQNVAAGTIVGGGSTITQQYVKIAYAYESDDATAQTLERKIREASDPARGGAREGGDPRALPEHGLLRLGRVGHRHGRRALLLQGRHRAHAGRGRHAGGHHPRPRGQQPDRQPRQRDLSPQHRARPDGRGGLHLRGAA
jgi:hypothetical protein